MFIGSLFWSTYFPNDQHQLCVLGAPVSDCSFGVGPCVVCLAALAVCLLMFREGTNSQSATLYAQSPLDHGLLNRRGQRVSGLWLVGPCRVGAVSSRSRWEGQSLIVGC